MSSALPWWHGRPRRSAAERRAQAQRAEARAVQRLLAGISELGRHRGCQPSRLGLALQRALSGGEELPGAGAEAAAAAPERSQEKEGAMAVETLPVEKKKEEEEEKATAKATARQEAEKAEAERAAREKAEKAEAERQEAEEAAEEDPTPTFTMLRAKFESEAPERRALKEQAQALRDQTRALLAGRERRQDDHTIQKESTQEPAMRGQKRGGRGERGARLQQRGQCSGTFFPVAHFARRTASPSGFGDDCRSADGGPRLQGDGAVGPSGTSPCHNVELAAQGSKKRA